ncbi:MAG TPA: hypothetical protein VEZ55_02745 [Chitinophagaceae bacterium]|jgi:hypothetical protein|nr:hypothetical protein [Chitinophagaceae bacterium]
MNEQQFYEVVSQKARDIQINPLLLLSGIEGLYSFKEVQLNAINYSLLDHLILTIFALRIGDHFRTLAEQNLSSNDVRVRNAATEELGELSLEYINRSSNSFLQSFAQVVNGKSTIRKYHEKALEVAALEIKNAQDRFQDNNIGAIILAICKTDKGGQFNLSGLFA